MHARAGSPSPTLTLPLAGVVDHDPSGKARQRLVEKLTAPALLFWVCLAFGFCTAQYWYLGSLKGSLDAGQHALGSRVAGGQQGGSATGSSSEQLEAVLGRVAPPARYGGRKEVLVAISNHNLVRTGQLPLWLETVQRAGIQNFLVVAIDTALRDYLQERKVNVFYKDIQISKSQEGTGANHAVSALKYTILSDFVRLGWNVLLSDVDIIVVQDPFKHLYRDHDLEAMTDGFDEHTAYGKVGGIDDPSMGWARYAQSTEHLNLNSGLFYLAANARTLGLLERVAGRLSREQAWDQSVFNQEIFFLSHGAYTAPHVTVRVMEMERFVNSKVLFRQLRYQAVGERVTPVMVHVNYHPDKYERMVAVKQAYLDGDWAPLMRMPGGSEPGS